MNKGYYRQHCAKRKLPVFNYSEADFELFRPAGATRCTDEGEIWHGGEASSMPNFTPIGAMTRV